MADENNQESIVSHLSADTDSSTVAIHHTLGPLPFQASPGSHVHDGKDSYKIDYNSLLNLPDIGGGAAEYTSTVKHEVKLGAAIAKGQAVYVSSADGTNMIVSKASNVSEATSSKTMGLLESGGATNAKVNVVTEGLLAGLDTSTATAGDVVWLGTDGNLIYGLASKPVAPAHLVFIGIVTRSNSNNGEIFIKPQNGFELRELHTVLLEADASITDNEVLAFDSASGLWKNQTAAEANIAAADHNHDGVYSPVGHTHDFTGDYAPLDGWTVNKVLVSNGAGAISVSTTIDTTELGYLNGVTDNLQTQLNGKVTDSFTASRVLVSNASGNAAASSLVSTTELDYLDGVTSNLQTQLNAKAGLGHTHIIGDTTGLQTALDNRSLVGHTHAISDVTGLQVSLDSKALAEGYTTNRVIVSNGSGAISVSPTIDTTELGYLNGVTSDIQPQINSKANNSGYTASRVLISDATGNVVVSPLVSTTELDFLDGVTSNIQTQLNGKSATGHTHITSEVTGLDTALAGKASTSHTHTIANVTGLQTALDGKAPLDGYTASAVLVSNALGSISTLNTVDTTELGYLNGVTSNIQTQISAKANNSGYTASRAMVSDVSGNLTVSSLVSTTELDYLDGVTSNLQTQLNAKAGLGHTHITSEVTGLDTALAGKASSTHTHAIADVTGLQTALDGKMSGTFPTGNRVMVTDATGAATISGTIDTTELGYLNGLTSGIQSQLNAKAVAGSGGVPFAMAANATTTAAGSALAINTQETATTVTFPTSRFSVTPSVTANTSSPRYVAAITSASSTGFTFIVRNVSDATGTTYTWNWMAVQMTSGAVSG